LSGKEERSLSMYAKTGRICIRVIALVGLMAGIAPATFPVSTIKMRDRL